MPRIVTVGPNAEQVDVHLHFLNPKPLERFHPHCANFILTKSHTPRISTRDPRLLLLSRVPFRWGDFGGSGAAPPG
jgi:hypothetical protein